MLRIKSKVLLAKYLVIVRDYKPDVIHVFGTEHTEAGIASLTNIPVTVHLQGLIWPYLLVWLPQNVSLRHIFSNSSAIKFAKGSGIYRLYFRIYRLFALELGRYANLTAQSLYVKFVLNGADIEIGDKIITVQLKKKRELPLIFEVMQKFNQQKYSRLNNKNIIFEGVSYS